MSVTRREVLKHGGNVLVASAGLLAVGGPARAACTRVNGAGSYRIGPFNHSKVPGKQVFIQADLGFDETMVFCKITTNFEPLLFPTFKLGVVEIGAHEFSMDMQATKISSLEFRTGADGPEARFTGTMRSVTRIGAGETAKTFIEESIRFGCYAVALGPSGVVQVSKTNFSMTLEFDPAKEHAAIFGETPIFGGHLISGNIIVVP